MRRAVAALGVVALMMVFPAPALASEGCVPEPVGGILDQLGWPPCRE